MLFGETAFVTDEIWAIESACTETRQEFFVPFKRLQLMPKMSAN